MVDCRYNPTWTCALYTKEGEKNVVATKTCELCMKAKEITKATKIMETAMNLHGEVNMAIRTLNTYTYRLRRVLEKLEADSP